MFGTVNQKLVNQQLVNKRATNQQKAVQQLINKKILIENIKKQKLLNQRLLNQRLLNKRLLNQRLLNQQISNQQISNQQISNQQISLNNKISNQQISNNKISNQNLANNQKLDNQEINTYISFITSFIITYDINTITELGCNEFKVSKTIYDELNIKYYGYDIDNNLINSYNKVNNINENSKYTFICSDFYKNKTEIINTDLCIIKDILTYWSLKEIYTFLDYIIENDIFKYILIINESSQTIDEIDETNTNNNQFRPLSANFYPLKKYNPVILYNYEPGDKEISLITTL